MIEGHRWLDVHSEGQCWKHHRLIHCQFIDNTRLQYNPAKSLRKKDVFSTDMCVAAHIAERLMIFCFEPQTSRAFQNTNLTSFSLNCKLIGDNQISKLTRLTSLGYNDQYEQAATNENNIIVDHRGNYPRRKNIPFLSALCALFIQRAALRTQYFYLAWCITRFHSSRPAAAAATAVWSDDNVAPLARARVRSCVINLNYHSFSRREALSCLDLHLSDSQMTSRAQWLEPPSNKKHKIKLGRSLSIAWPRRYQK